MQEQATKQTKGKFLPKKKKRKTGWIIGIAVVAAAALLIGILSEKKTETPLLDLADTTVLAYTDLQNTISANGIVESADTTMVYSMVSYPVMAIHVEVGDQVEAGALLAELDGKTIQNQIATQEITLDVANQSSAQQVESAWDNYDNFKSGLDQGLNSTLNGAKVQADNAYDAYIKAKTAYDRYEDSLNLGENTTLLSAEAALRNAEDALQTASDSYDRLVDSYWEAEDAFDALQTQWDDANRALETTKSDLDDVGLQINAAAAELADLHTIAEEDLTPDLIDRMAELEAQLSQLDQEQASLTADRVEQELTVFMLRSSYEEAQAALTQLDAQVGSAKSALRKAEAAYDTQISTYNATLTTVDNTLADYWTNVETAWKAYQNALTSLAATE